MIATLAFTELKKQGEIMTLTQSMLVTFVLLKKIRVHSTINKQEYVNFCWLSFVIVIIIIIIIIIIVISV